MKLEQIDKALYRHRLNRVIISFIIGFALLGVGLGQAFIELFADVNAQSNFKFNLAGVIVGLVLSSAALHKLKSHDYFEQIYYVWRLKQLQNLVYRKLAKIKLAAFDDKNIDAINTLAFYYHSQLQVYQLDDNTLTLSSVKTELNKVETLASDCHLTLSDKQLDKSILNQF